MLAMIRTRMSRNQAEKKYPTKYRYLHVIFRRNKYAFDAVTLIKMP